MAALDECFYRAGAHSLLLRVSSETAAGKVPEGRGLLRFVEAAVRELR